MIIAEPVRHLSYICGDLQRLCLIRELVTVEKRELLRIVVPVRLESANDVVFVFLVRAYPPVLLTGTAL